MTHSEIVNWLRQPDVASLEELWRQADTVRRSHVGDQVHLRGLIEISSHCVRHCAYCGLRAPNASLLRYRMTAREILDCALQARQFGYGTVVLQAGEDPEIGGAWIADVIRNIKAMTYSLPGGNEEPLAVTLSLGERGEKGLAMWRQAGADRYLLRFETSNRVLYDRIHPPRQGEPSDRIAMLRRLRELGYEIGSGVMIGIPGQTYEDLAQDIELFAELDLDMIGVGPYLPHPATPLGQQFIAGAAENADDDRTLDQVPNTELMTYKVIALARLACPRANIPSTTALATLNRNTGRELGLARGANVVMPNLTPPQYRSLYEIYPDKACLFETAERCRGCMRERIAALGRTVGTGPGGSMRQPLTGYCL